MWKATQILTEHIVLDVCMGDNIFGNWWQLWQMVLVLECTFYKERGRRHNFWQTISISRYNTFGNWPYWTILILTCTCTKIFGKLHQIWQTILINDLSKHSHCGNWLIRQICLEATLSLLYWCWSVGMPGLISRLNTYWPTKWTLRCSQTGYARLELQRQ